MVQDRGEEIFIELKCIRELLRHLNTRAGMVIRVRQTNLPDTVNPLEEDRTPVRVIVFVVPVTHAMGELVAKAQPLLLNQNLEIIMISFH